MNKPELEAHIAYCRAKIKECEEAGDEKEAELNQRKLMTKPSKKTQGQRLIALLKKRPMTTMELLQTGISTCPWKRIKEALSHDETLTSRKNGDGLKVYMVEKSYTPRTVWVKNT